MTELVCFSFLCEYLGGRPDFRVFNFANWAMRKLMES